MPKDDNAGFLPDWNKMSGADKIPASSEAGGVSISQDDIDIVRKGLAGKNLGGLGDTPNPKPIDDGTPQP